MTVWDGLVDWPDEINDRVDELVDEGWDREAAELKISATSRAQPVIRIRK